jgi:threonine/homoserine/homoserine lactone efflux protein
MVVLAPRGEDGNVDTLLVGPFVRGLVLGLAVAAPVGPMSLLCMRQTLARGFFAGMASGLGVATADGVYGAIAAFGLVAIADALIGQQPWLRVVGGLAMAYLGIGAMRTRAVESVSVASGSGLARTYTAMFALTMMNPSTILSFAALFAGLGLGGGTDDSSSAPLLVAGVFIGSALWWLVVTGGLSLARTRLSPRVQRTINLAAGLVLVGFGLVAIGSVLL